MLSKESLTQFTKTFQTVTLNVAREYCQHLFLSYLYQLAGSDRLLFKGGTALRIVFRSPRFSEDLDFTGSGITTAEVESLFTDTLIMVEKSGIPIELEEGKPTTGGYIGIGTFTVHDLEIPVHIEVSLRTNKKRTKGTRVLIANDYIPAYTLTHMPEDELITGKLAALMNRHKPRDFYDFFFLLSSNYPQVRDTAIFKQVLVLLNSSKINFHYELKQFLPASHSLHLRDFKKMLEQKIREYMR